MMRREQMMKFLSRVVFGGFVLALSGTLAVAQEKKITAREVVDRKTLKAFVLEGKKYLEGIRTLTETAKLRDVFRAEGDWRAGNLFLMMLIKNGSVLLHGGDFRIDNKNLLNVEDDKGKKVVQELLAAAARGGDFVEYHWDDPSVEGDANPKVSYAVGYTSGLSGRSLVLVGGYSQDVSNVYVEVPEFARPEVTASEVVDRKTLKAFVEGATKVYRDGLRGDYSQLANAKNALKQEGGYWKSGSIYVFVISDEGFVLVHGARLSEEGKTVLHYEDINGVKFIEELIAAAKGGGGYVEYNWDDPLVKGDEDTGSPKLSYANGFTLPGRDELFVVGTGIYKRAKEIVFR